MPADSPPDAPRLVVGLGNPGAEYHGTRHNLGFEVLDGLAERFGLKFARQARTKGLGPVRAKACAGDNAAGPFLLVKPWTYMNLSGEAVAAYARFYRLRPESIFVIVDDLNLPLGRMRIRAGGSPGGHNGLKSLIACLGTEGFPRLRMGIAIPDADAGPSLGDMTVHGDMADFVTDAFSDEERELLAPTLEDAVEAVTRWLNGDPLQDLMNRYNAVQNEVHPSDSDQRSPPDSLREPTEQTDK
ncbi:MAG: aminoacyl-tRNA hydrolase [Planctomycetes bacterium]|nr:aminoacyl-tRNA hydrolase [Planctomycetota bacterium]